MSYVDYYTTRINKNIDCIYKEASHLPQYDKRRIKYYNIINILLDHLHLVESKQRYATQKVTR